jgi:hypothetical protein
MYEQGLGIPRDEAAAYAWYKQAAKQGDPVGARRVGVMLETGRGVSRDLQAAKHSYQQAAAQGDAASQAALKRLNQPSP